MSLSHHVWVANSSSQDMYVLVAPSTEFLVTDLITDTALMFVGIGEIKAALTAGRFPEVINTMADVYKFLKAFALLGSGTSVTALRSFQDAKNIAAKLKNSMGKISPNDCKEVSSHGFLSIYTSASGYASLAGAKTLTITVMSDDYQLVAQWDTDPDHSWVLTDDAIVRSAYGQSLFMQDPAAGKVDWSK